MRDAPEPLPRERFDEWLRQAEERHLADLTFSQVSSGLRALSSTYVERRHRLGEGAALDGAGKRAAFALFYAPLHFLLVRSIGIRGHSAKPRGRIATSDWRGGPFEGIFPRGRFRAKRPRCSRRSR